MKPDTQRVRALSGHLSEAERMWKGLPSEVAMRSHMDALQQVLSEMLDAPATPEQAQVQGIKRPPKLADDIINIQLAHTLEAIGRPDAITLALIRSVARGELGEFLNRAGNGCHFRGRLAHVGYDRIDNPRTQCRKWFFPGGPVVVYVRRELSVEEGIAAARALAEAYFVGRAGPKKLDRQPSTPLRAAESTQRPLSVADPCQTEGLGQ